MTNPPIQTRHADSKGRITLGEAYANRTLIVEKRGDELVLHVARVVPERESWLYENPKALKAVRTGLRQAKERQFSKNPPDLKSAERFAKDLEDN
ncbi:MAG: hypothetical protein HY286_16360 [Planctomycetes bacterium]|nr:hypothetical protein [Planctomycetota bacterium]